ncbi:hypothetical protein ABZP36_028357 [Zizania latifolia]
MARHRSIRASRTPGDRDERGGWARAVRTWPRFCHTLGISFHRYAGISRSGVSRLLTMKLIAAYLLAVLGGNTSPTADDVKNILESVGVEANEERLEFLLSELEGKDITEVIAAGREKFASVPSGGGAVAVAAPAAAAGGAAPTAESKKEEKVEEKEESDDDMGFSLFD